MTAAEYDMFCANMVGPDDWPAGSVAAAYDSSAASVAPAVAAATAPYAQWQAHALEPAWKTRAKEADAASLTPWLESEVVAPAASAVPPCTKAKQWHLAGSGTWLRDKLVITSAVPATQASATSAVAAVVPATQASASSAAAAAVPATQASAAVAAVLAAVPAIQASGAAADQTAASSYYRPAAAVAVPTASPCADTDIRMQGSNKLDRAPHISTIFQTLHQQQQQQTRQQW
jgi:hypothetical protein